MQTMKRFLLAALLAWAACGGSETVDPNAMTFSVGGVFAAGSVVRDGYSGKTAKVASDGTVTLAPDPNGVVLLEKNGAAAAPFSWQNVTMYQVVTDRYLNGDPTNDGNYGRKKDGEMEVGTWHGGDWKGMTSKLDYIAGLGVDALWISPVVEQVHGWVGGGGGAFKNHGFMGYWALDFTRLDRNYGTVAELQALIDAAHQRGIRVLVDVVMNHPGYATGADLLAYLPEVFKDGTGAAFTSFDQTATSGSYLSWNDLVNYSSTSWSNWWSPKWIRAGFPGFPQAGSTEETKQLNSLPDFITESTTAADAPVLFTRKTDTGFVAQPGFSVRQYLVKWHTDWVRQLGIDGFRVDTVNNVEKESFAALKQAGLAALAEWKAQNPSKKLDDAPFWMTAEAYGHNVVKDGLYTAGGFDSVINFELQRNAVDILRDNDQLVAAADAVEEMYARYAAVLPAAGFQILSYLSSHDTYLMFEAVGNDAAKQRFAGTLLLLAPGGVNIYYGDESGRPPGPRLNDNEQATRSDMNFASTDSSILTHWQKLGSFRKRHAAVGGGAHQKLDSPAGTYAFSRKLGDDAVVVILTSTR